MKALGLAVGSFVAVAVVSTTATAALKASCAKPAVHTPAAKSSGKPGAPAVPQAPACEAAAAEVALRDIRALILKSQTATRPADRRQAIHALGDGYDGVNHPEILVAFVYALSDADASVRAKAADELGDQIRRHPECCAKEIVAALTVALSDQHRSVRNRAERALRLCRQHQSSGLNWSSQAPVRTKP